MVTNYKKNLNGYPVETYFVYVSPQTFVWPCSTKKLLTSELEIYNRPLFFREWTQLDDLAKSRMRSLGLFLRITILTEWLRHFNDLSVGDRGSSKLFAGERGGGRDATTAKSLK